MKIVCVESYKTGGHPNDAKGRPEDELIFRKRRVYDVADDFGARLLRDHGPHGDGPGEPHHLIRFQAYEEPAADEGAALDDAAAGDAGE
jgi:hypothetical protein